MCSRAEQLQFFANSSENFLNHTTASPSPYNLLLNCEAIHTHKERERERDRSEREEKRERKIII
jgi:hypothetical protein